MENGESFEESPEPESAGAFAAKIFDRIHSVTPQRQGPAEFQRFFLREVGRRMEGFQPRTDIPPLPYPTVDVIRKELFVALDPARQERIDFALVELDPEEDATVATLDFFYSQTDNDGNISVVKVNLGQAEGSEGKPSPQLWFYEQRFPSTPETISELNKFFRGELPDIPEANQRVAVESRIFSGDEERIVIEEQASQNMPITKREIPTADLLNQQLIPLPQTTPAED